MLGWEFPPVISGGLGIASQGLATALAKNHNVTFILPKTTGEDMPGHLKLLGLNQASLFKDRTITESVHEEEKPADISASRLIFEEIALEAFPYENEEDIPLTSEKTISVTTESRPEKVTQKQAELHETPESILSEELFEKSELYGKKLVEKSIQYARLSKKLAGDLTFDVIHAHDWMTFLAGIEIRKVSKKPLVLHVHSLAYDREGPNSRSWTFELEKHAFQQADMILAVSNYTADVIQAQYGVDRTKIAVVYNALGPMMTGKAKKKIKEKLVLFVGRITSQKGPEFFLQIIQEVVSSYPDVRFLFAGSGDQLKKLIESAADKKIAGKVSFSGFVPRAEVFDLYAMADIYVMPSVSEPFGLTALEAAHSGIPVIITNQSGVAEVMPHALKADYGDTDTFVQHILTLLRDEKEGEKRVKQTLKSIQKLSWDNSAKQAIGIYERLTENA